MSWGCKFISAAFEFTMRCFGSILLGQGADLLFKSARSYCFALRHLFLPKDAGVRCRLEIIAKSMPLQVPKLHLKKPTL